ncbi:hypothetical protein M9458_009297, partial [Cirrhinus mrigala]
MRSCIVMNPQWMGKNQRTLLECYRTPRTRPSPFMEMMLRQPTSSFPGSCTTRASSKALTWPPCAMPNST